MFRIKTIIFDSKVDSEDYILFFRIIKWCLSGFIFKQRSITAKISISEKTNRDITWHAVFT